jgi:integrase
MTPKPIRSGRSGRKGWRYRYADPATGRRNSITMWFSERREADRGFKEFMDGREAKCLGLPDKSGWKMPYDELVTKFITEAPLSTERRRNQLRRILERNELSLAVGSDLASIGKLTAACRKLVEKCGEHYVIFSVQRTLKQMSRWAASVGILPHDPLQTWSRLPWSGQKKQRRAFLPDEIMEILKAAEDFDIIHSHRFPSAPVFKTLLLTGNRPGAVFAAKLGDLNQGRIVLSSGVGKKRNGMATLPQEFVADLRQYIALRGITTVEDPLLVSHEGQQIHRVNMSKYFERCMTLAFVRMSWPPKSDSTVTPFDIAHLLYTGKQRGLDGTPPRDPAKLAKRVGYKQAVETVAAQITLEVSRRLKGRDMYCLRKTHISWARQLTNPDSVRLQVGHAARDVEEKHYLDFVDARLSSQAVWDVLTGAKKLNSLQAATEKLSTPGTENSQSVVANVVHENESGEKAPIKNRSGSAQVIDTVVVGNGAGEGVRTLDFDLGNTSHQPKLHLSNLDHKPLSIGNNH